MRRDEAEWHNLYLAVRPPPEVAAAISAVLQAFRRRHRITGRPVPPERFHISLVGLGPHLAVPDDLLAKVARGVLAAAAGTPCFDVELNRIDRWRKGRQGKPFLVLTGDEGVYGIGLLRRHLETALADLSLIERGHADDEPHLTLLYDTPARTGLEFAQDEVPFFCWRVGEVALVDSRVGQGRHEILGRWPLAPCGAESAPTRLG